MAIRWNIQDRVSGQRHVVAQPSNQAERDNLSAVIKNVSALGVVRGGK